MFIPKRKIFISYHHANDRPYFDGFSNFFCEQYDMLLDNSPERALNSENIDYIRWSLRQNNIKGSSCTIVLCGSETWKRKYVDWEIKYTLDMGHALIGIHLPSNPIHPSGGTNKPDRLQENIDSGYAKFLQWDQCTLENVKNLIEIAIQSSARLIKNDMPMRIRNS